MSDLVPVEIIARKIFLIRGQKIMLSSDLASLYDVEVRASLQAVKRNIKRFPEDFMFQLSKDEWKTLRSQFVTLEKGRGKYPKYLPYAFTEQGVAMLSSVLNSERAISVNIAIMRAFVKVREYLAAHKEVLKKLEEHDRQIKTIFEVINKLLLPPPRLSGAKSARHGAPSASGGKTEKDGFLNMKRIRTVPFLFHRNRPHYYSMTENELKLILDEGEGYRIEFKENLSNLDKELVSFANSSGGKIYLGISDNREIKGILVTNKLKSQIQDTANNCQPSVKILFEEYKKILIVEVREGEDKPYKCSSGFYTRVGPNSQKLSRDDIIDFFKAEGKIGFDELVNLKFDYKKHFDPKKLVRFLRLAGITNLLDIPTTLVNLGVAEKQEGKLIFNNTGILFFSKNLADIYFHTAVTCALYRGKEKVEVLDRKDFNEDIISNIDDAMNFLKKHIPVRYEMTGMPRRKEVPEIPFDALREAVINAVAHRDYFEKGTNVMVEMFDDKIVITNFGGLPKGLKPKDFGKKSVLRNPRIADLLNKIEYIEKMGTGIKKIRKLMRKAGLKPPKFEFDTFFTATFSRPLKTKRIEKIQGTTPKSSQKKFGDRFGEKFGESSEKILEIILSNKNISAREIAKKMNITSRAIEKHIAKLKKKGILRRFGPDKGGHWVILKDE